MKTTSDARRRFMTAALCRLFSDPTARFQPSPPIFSIYRPFQSLPPIFSLYNPFSVSTTHFQPSPAHITLLAAFSVHLASCRSHIMSLKFRTSIYCLSVNKLSFFFSVYQNWKYMYLMLDNKFKSGVPPKLRPTGAEYELNDDQLRNEAAHSGLR